MFCSRTFDNMINKVHERALRVRLNARESDFKTLQNNNGICNHHRNIQALLIEIFKIRKGFAPPIMDVRNSRVTKSSYKTELRKMMSHFEFLTRKFYRNSSFELLTQLHEILT